jgi:cytochrome c oxidase subunit 6a
MLSRQLLFRATQRAGQSCRSSLLRQGLQRRFASQSEAPLTGAADNEFNRERLAVKAHAARTAGRIEFRRRIARHSDVNSS